MVENENEKRRHVLTFHCGAMARVDALPVPQDTTGIRKSDLRDGMLRVCTWRSSVKGLRPVHSNGQPADCPGCPCPRAAGRRRYECFPPDYDAERDGKYANRRFKDFCVHVIACFPKTVNRET